MAVPCEGITYSCILKKKLRKLGWVRKGFMAGLAEMLQIIEFIGTIKWFTLALLRV